MNEDDIIEKITRSLSDTRKVYGKKNVIVVFVDADLRNELFYPREKVDLQILVLTSRLKIPQKRERNLKTVPTQKIKEL